ncbi:MAG: 3-hydroxyacyl-ACP dehydratase FabZ [Geminicoccaceae bacterium]
MTAFERAVGIKGVTLNEPFFQGHFPGDPIMPGVLVIEAMAQTAAVLTVASRKRVGQGDGVYFMAIDEARFRQPVRPGVILSLEVVKQRQKLGIWRFSGMARTGDTLVAETSFTAKVLDA